MMPLSIASVASGGGASAAAVARTRETSIAATRQRYGRSSASSPRSFRPRPADRQALALAARERQAALADQGVVALRQRGHELVGLRAPRCGDDVLAAGVGAGVGDVLVHAGREQEWVVGDEGGGVAQRFE